MTFHLWLPLWFPSATATTGPLKFRGPVRSHRLNRTRTGRPLTPNRSDAISLPLSCLHAPREIVGEWDWFQHKPKWSGLKNAFLCIHQERLAFPLLPQYTVAQTSSTSPIADLGSEPKPLICKLFFMEGMNSALLSSRANACPATIHGPSAWTFILSSSVMKWKM